MQINNRSDKPCIFITLNSPFTNNIYSRIGIKELKNTFSVVLINFLNCFNKDFNKNNYYKEFIDEDIECININDINDFKSLCILKKPLFSLDCIGKSENTFLIQSICKKYKITYVYDGLASSISSSKIINLFLYFSSKLPDFISTLIFFNINRISKKNFIRPDVVITASRLGTVWQNSAKKIIYCSSNDFIRSRKVDDNFQLKVNKKKYILFLDDCLIHSFDFKLGNQRENLTEEVYFKKLNSFFENIEAKYNMPIVIAAHPNGIEFDHYSKLFGNRLVFFNKTCELSKECYFAITHYSLSINYAILFEKPIIFLKFDGISKRVKNIQKIYMSWLNTCILNIDNFLTLPKNINNINKEKYQLYRSYFIYSVDESISSQYEPLVNYFKINANR